MVLPLCTTLSLWPRRVTTTVLNGSYLLSWMWIANFLALTHFLALGSETTSLKLPTPEPASAAVIAELTQPYVAPTPGLTRRGRDGCGVPGELRHTRSMRAPLGASSTRQAVGPRIGFSTHSPVDSFDLYHWWKPQ